MNTRRVGSEKEQEARRYLEKKGYEIVTTNYWCRYAEIDIVARDRGALVFVEVKYRKNAEYGNGTYAVSEKKIRNISRCARYYIYKEHVPPDVPMRFDVIAIDGDTVTHLVNAFEAL